MSSNTALGRHRAEVVKTSPISVITKAVSSNAGGVGRQAAVIAAASGLVLTSGIAANAATPTVERASDGGTTLSQNTQLASAVTAKSTVKISFATPKVTSTPAPVAEAPVVATQSDAVVQTGVANAAAPVATTTAAAPAQAAAAPTVTVTNEAPAAKPATTSGVGARIIAAAYAQLGVMQDCTMLVTNSMTAAGLPYFHGWPADYLSLGRTVSQGEAQPGDLIYYADGGAGMAHIAVYAGNGMAVHGGFYGNQTKLYSVNVGSPPVFIAMGH